MQRRLRRLLLIASCCLLLPATGASAAGGDPLEKAFWGPVRVDGKSQFPIYKRLGVTLYQSSLSWAAVAPTRPANPRDPRDPAYRWPAETDDALAQARRNGIRVLIQVIGSPPWANGGKSWEWAPRRTRDFADFVRAAARRYPAVRHWMVWGEPSRSHNFKPFVEQPLGTRITAEQKRAPRRYARLLDAAYGQLKAQRRSNLVIGGNTYVTGEVRPAAWLRAMKLPGGRPPRMDLYGHNPFSYRNPDLRNRPSANGLVDFSDLARFDRQIQRYLGRPRRRTIRMFLSEFTVATAPDIEFNFYVSHRTQARWIKNGFRVARKVNAAGLGWIHLYDGPLAENGLAVNGGLITREGRRKPGFYAFMRGALTPAQRARERRRLRAHRYRAESRSRAASRSRSRRASR